MTGRDLISASLRLIGALAPGESLESAEATDGLAALNRMISSWSTESLLIYATEIESFPLIAAKAVYTMGTGGDFNTTRPQRINIARLRQETSTPAVEFPINLLTEEEYADFRVKDITSPLPLYLYVENTYPLATLTFYAVPSYPHKVVLYSWKQLTQIATLDTDISLPPGYEEALIYNFCIRLAPEYGRMVPDAVGLIANESKANIQRMNHKPQYLKGDDGLLSGGSFNILTGDFR